MQAAELQESLMAANRALMIQQVLALYVGECEGNPPSKCNTFIIEFDQFVKTNNLTYQEIRQYIGLRAKGQLARFLNRTLVKQDINTWSDIKREIKE
jgi:hypothetical protein